MAGFFRFFEVDRFDLGQREVAFIVGWAADHAFDGVAGAQAVLADHVGGDVDIIGARQVVRFGRTQETETILQHFKHTVAADDPVFFGAFFQDREHHLALAHGRGVLDLELFGE